MAEIEQTAPFSFSLLLMYVEKAVKGERKKVLEEEEKKKHLPPNHLKMLFSLSENFFGGEESLMGARTQRMRAVHDDGAE